MKINKLSKLFLVILTIAILGCFSVVQAQDYWTALPPYNTLWPLWSPALSPLDAAGVATPLITSLAPSTILPVQPGLTWNPSLDYPWLLYNTPSGLAYYDPFYGVNTWPASSLIDSAGAALPIALPDLYNTLPPTSSAWLGQNVFFGNYYFLESYPSLLAATDPAVLLASATFLLPKAIYGALLLGIPIPPATLATVFPPQPLTSFLTPASLLGW